MTNYLKPETKKFIKEVKTRKWGVQDGKPLKEWKYFERDSLDAAWGAAWGAAWDAARDAARDAAWGAARDAAWGAARDAARNAAWDAARNAAWDAARDAAWDAAVDAAWGAAVDAALYAGYLEIINLVKDNNKLQKHWKFVERVWQVYQKGYWLYCDVDGVLYVYGVKKK